MKKHRLLSIAGLIAAFFALPASAQLNTNGLYVGGSLGRAHFKDVCASSVITCEDRDTAFSLFAGWQVVRYVAVEVGYRDFGHATVDTGNVKGNAVELDAVATIPIISRFSVLGRLGVFHGNLKGEGVEERKNGATYGAGIQYDLSQQTALRGEWQRYRRLGGGDFGATTDIESFSLAALFRFR